MSVIVVCPECQRKLRIQDDVLGKKIRCPGCKGVVPTQRPVDSSVPPPVAPLGKPAPKAAVPQSVKPAAPIAKPPRREEPEEEEVSAPTTPPPVKGKGKKKSRAGRTLGILALVGILLIAACGGIAYGAWVYLDNAANQLKASLPVRPSHVDPIVTDKANTDSKPVVGDKRTDKTTIGDKPKDIEEEIKRVAAKSKLAPLELTLGGATLTMMAPEKARSWSSAKSAGVEALTEYKFGLHIQPGHIDFPTAKEIWKKWPAEKLTGLVIDAPPLVLREFTTQGDKLVSDGTHFRFVLNASFGHLDVHFTNIYSTREECLLMLHCARTAALKEPYTPPATLADLEKYGLQFERDGDKVKGVNAGNALLTDALLALIAKLLPELEVLDLSQAAITTKGLSAVADLKNLRKLYLPIHRETALLGPVDSVLNGAGLIHVAGLTKLETLWVGDMVVADDQLIHFKELTNLKALDLPRTQVTGTGFVHLAGLVNVEKVNLLDSQFSDAGVKHLAGMKKMRELTLAGTPLTGEGFADFPGLPELAALNLDHSQFNDVGLEPIRITPSGRKL